MPVTNTTCLYDPESRMVVSSTDGRTAQLRCDTMHWGAIYLAIV